MSVSPTDVHPDLAALDGPMIPLAWLMQALAESERSATEEQDRTNDLRHLPGDRFVDFYASGMRDATQFIHDQIAHRLDPAAYEAEEARRCAAFADGVDPDGDQGGTR